MVISEREGNENEPLFLLGEAVQQAAFRVHPYHHEIIGDMADLRTMTRDDLYRHYRVFYVPNNAVLSVAGDFKTSEMLRRIRKLFAHFPAGHAPPRTESALSRCKWGRHGLRLRGQAKPSYVQVAYRFPPAAHKDFFALSVLDSLMAGPGNLNMFGGGGISNKTSRLYRALVDKEFVVGFSGGSSPTVDPFLYSISLTVHPKRQPAEALTALDGEISKAPGSAGGAGGDPQGHQASSRQFRLR